MSVPSIAITLLATSLIIASQTTPTLITFIDITVIKETDKAVLVEFNDKDTGEATGRSEWLPKKALTASKLMGNDIYTVVEWFNEVVDHAVLNGHCKDFGYTVPIG